MSSSKHDISKSGDKKVNPFAVVILVVLMGILGVFVWQNYVTSSFEPTVEETPSAIDSPDPVESEEPVVDKLIDFNPHCVESTEPSLLISSTEVSVNGELVENYQLEDEIDFGLGEDYTEVTGIITFRGNNFRDGGSYGVASIVDRKFGTSPWNVATGALTAPNGTTWNGSGWVGQPLIVSWPKQTREHMNMYDWAKQADSLTEVIYATMDGNIYFLDLATGKQTRDKLYLGYTFKGSGALDPRGYPILYLGSGYDSSKGRSHAFIINLLDCTVMYEFGQGDPFSLRGTLSYFDGSALVDAETDQLIYPGENGILYIIRLNTQYDEDSGTLSISPDQVVRWRYNGVRTTKASFWLGMEDSAVILRGHIIMSDNGGNLMCLDLKTLTLDWVQDVLDDTNCSPVLEIEDGHPYVYISTSFHGGWRAYTGGTATIPVWKIDAETGEIVWQVDYSCYTEDGVSGGTQGTIAIGKNKLSNLVYAPVARTPSASAGILAAIDKSTGEVVWEQETQMYAWSSPTIVYDEQGNGYVILCTTGGYIYLFDGLTGEILDYLDLGSNMEASPAVYNNTVVVGTRGNGIYGITLS
jgi:hypothetical protein